MLLAVRNSVQVDAPRSASSSRFQRWPYAQAALEAQLISVCQTYLALAMPTEPQI